jgi:AbiV family abortive infection protein
MGRNVTIPLAQLGTGISMALDRARALVEEARTLAEAGAVLGASVLFSHGIEELGKAWLLRNALENKKPQVMGFGDHNAKLNAAAGLLPVDHLTLFEGAFGSAFDNAAFGVATTTDWATRLESLYAEWDGNKWTAPPALDGALLRDNIGKVLSFIAAKQKEWCS